MLTSITCSVMLEASYISGNHEEIRFPCEAVEMDLNFEQPLLVVRGIAAHHVGGLRWIPDSISFDVPEVAQRWTFKLRGQSAGNGLRSVRFMLASALPFATPLDAF